MTLLIALSRAQQQRHRHRPLDQVLAPLLTAIQHATAQSGAWLAEVVPDDTGEAQLRVRASTGTLRSFRISATSPAVQQALHGRPATLSWASPLGPLPTTLVPIGADGETHGLIALAGAEAYDPAGPLASDVQALGTVVATWLEAERGRRAERRSQRRLERSAQRYRAMVHDGMDAVVVVDEDGAVVEANRQADRLLPGGETWFGRLLFDHLEADELPPMGRRTFRLHHDQVPLDTAVHQVAGPDGCLRVLVMRDTQEQRRAANALRDVNRELEKRVDELGRLNRENELLGDLGAFLQASRGLAEVHAVVRRFAGQLFGGSGAMYAFEEGELSRKAAWGSQELPQHMDASACWGLRRGELHTCDGDQGLACAHSPGPDATACVPVMSASGPVALLHIVGAADGGGQARRERLLRAVADRLGAALTTLALQERLRQESIRDPLTRLYNRRYMVETMDRELARTRRAGQPLAVVMMDVDRFKKLNDEHGHDVGDRVLQEVARRMTASVRAEDVVCRYGGEEFVAILPGATEELARARAESLRQHLCAVGLHGRDGPLPPVTLSAGVAVATDRMSPERLLRQADLALLHAKETGRNQVVMASELEPGGGPGAYSLREVSDDEGASAAWAAASRATGTR